MTAPHSCGGCATRWSGANTAHCASCHLTFGGVGPFDDHRVRGACVHPAEMAKPMIQVRPGVWGRGDPNASPRPAQRDAKGRFR